MKHECHNDSVYRNNIMPSFRRGLFVLFVLSVYFMPARGNAQDIWPQVAMSTDGTPIAYEVYGKGDPCLVFVHGWSCDSRYWRAQVPYFSKKYKVIVLDLAGHGNSGLSRVVYSMEAFGRDVRAVIEAAQSDRVILIGHSMGGAVISEAARQMPEGVLGLIGVDTLQDVEYAMTRKKMGEMTDALKKDFATGCRQFVGTMIRPDSDRRLMEWVIKDMSSAPPAVALSAMNDMFLRYLTGEAATVFESIAVPVVCVNADLWPVNEEANKRHMKSFQAIVIKNTDHFLMMNKPEIFNPELEKAIRILLDK